MEVAGNGAEGEDAWPGAQKLNMAQEILDINKILINQINYNHAARTPDNLARNVSLIRELKANIMKVVQIYQDLSEFLTHIGGEEAAAQLTTVMAQAKQ